jgi:hypothetical protein
MAWQFYRMAASGSRERLQASLWPSAYLGIWERLPWGDFENVDGYLDRNEFFVPTCPP